MARMTLEEALARPSAIDRAKLDATTEDDIRRYQVEDGYGGERDLGDPVEIVPPGVIRARLAMTQQEFAAALRIPVGTLRNWEQGRTAIEPAARSLLDAVWRDPVAVLAALRPPRREPTSQVG